MADKDTRMVLRTVYLPPELDEKLRVQAFRRNVSKNDLIRQALARELESTPIFQDDVKPPKSPRVRTSRAQSTTPRARTAAG